MMKRTFVLLYGVTCYLIFLSTFLYAIGFIGNIYVPKSIDSTPTDPMGKALTINLVLLAIFALQHSVMARPAFKRWWTQYVPKPMERSTYVLFTCFAMILMFWQWRPMGGTIWTIEHPFFVLLMYTLFAMGWLIVLVTTFLINHFDLFGLRQVYLYFRGIPYTPLRFVTPGPYRFVRHPLYVGWFLSFWATPTMTAAHLVFALMTTLYIVIAVRYEERDLIAAHGLHYIKYRNSVPKFFPALISAPTKATYSSESRIDSKTTLSNKGMTG